jgi:tetratricopeptide (TPR) repeat protein
MSRKRNLPDTTLQPEHSTTLKVLVIVSRPLNDSELLDIADSLILVEAFSQIEASALIHFLQPPTVESLRIALGAHWDVIHFDGHGMAEISDNYLVLEDETGLAEYLSGSDFAQMLSLAGSLPSLMVFSSCESATGDMEGLAGKMAQIGVPAVIGTLESVTTDWTAALMRPLYTSLANGRSIHESYNYAREALRTIENPFSSTESYDLPVLIGSNLHQSICDGQTSRGLIIKIPKLINWTETWQGEFHGDFIDKDENAESIEPPQGRKGIILQIIRALVRGEKLVTITGMGGIGKTVLAAVIAYRIAWKYPGGIFWVDGRDYLDSSIPLEALLDQFDEIFGLDFVQHPLDRKKQMVRKFINQLGHACLIVIDNADVASSELMRFISELPAPSASLITAREAPERGGTVINVSSMDSSESWDFLVREIGRRKNDPNWFKTEDEGDEVASLNEEELDALNEINNLLEGHPLELMQGAAIIASDGIKEARELIRQHPAQGREIQVRFDFSYLPLSSTQKSLLHRLAAFVSDFDEQAIMAICTDQSFVGDNDSLSAWKSDLRLLRDKSLIEQYTITKDYHRYRLHPVMRDYLRLKASKIPLDVEKSKTLYPDASNAMMVEDYRVAQYFFVLAEILSNHIDSKEDAIRVLAKAEREHVNLIAAYKFYKFCKSWDDVIQYAFFLHSLLERSGKLQDLKEVLKMGLEAARADQNEPIIAGMLHLLATVSVTLGDYPDARKYYKESLDIRREIDDESGTASSMHDLGILEQANGNYELAEKLYKASLDYWRRVGSNLEIAKSYHQLGTLAQAKFNLNQAEEFYEKSRKIRLEQNEKKDIHLILLNLGTVAQEKGDYKKAQQLYMEATEIASDLGDKRMQAAIMHNCATLVHGMGDFENAKSLYDMALSISKEIDDKEGIIQGLYQLGMLEKDQGNYDRALDLHNSSLEIARQLDIKLSIAKSLQELGVLARNGGNLAEAEKLYKEAMELSEEIDNPQGVAAAYHELGTLALMQGHIVKAKENYQQALTLSKRMNFPRGIAMTTTQLAVLAATEGNRVGAILLAREAYDIYESLGGSPIQKDLKKFLIYG